MDPTSVDTLRRLNALESKVAHLQTIEHGPTLGELYATFLGLPGLRAFWPFSSTDESAGVRDLSGQGRTLSANGGLSTGVLNDLIPYYAFNGTTGYLNRADEAGVKITGSLTLGGWFYLNNLTGIHPLVCKDNTTSQRSYALYTSGASLAFSGFGAGTNTASVATTAAAWHFLAGRFTASVGVDAFADNVKGSNTTTPNATLTNSTAPLTVGSDDLTTRWLAGNTCLCFLCAAPLTDTLLTYLWQRSAPLFGLG